MYLGPGLLGAIRTLHREDDLNMSIGLSNVSFGLPARRSLNGATLLMAMEAGLTAAILDMTHKEIRHAVLAANLIRGRDEYSMNWISNYRAEQARGRSAQGQAPPGAELAGGPPRRLHEALSARRTKPMPLLAFSRHRVAVRQLRVKPRRRRVHGRGD